MLKIMHIDWNEHISGTVPVEYANLAFMETFDILDTKIMEPFPSGLCHGGEGGLTIHTNKKCPCCSSSSREWN